MIHVLDTILARGFKFASRTIGPHPWTRFVVLGMMYAVVVLASLLLAYQLRWDFAVPEDFVNQWKVLIGPVLLSKLLLLYSFGQFRSVLSYFGLHDLWCVIASTSLASGIMIGLWFISATGAAPPRGVILMDFLLSTAGIVVVRLALRLGRERSRMWDPRADRACRRIGIIGAGDVGSTFVSDLLKGNGQGLLPVFALDDDPRKFGRSLHGVPVTGPITRLPELARDTGISELVITMPSASPKKLKEVIALAQQCGLRTNLVPSMSQLADGSVQVQAYRPVELEDLLGREPANLDSVGIAELLYERVVMVTGAGGSIGSELCRQILTQGAQRVLLVDQSEVQLFAIEQELVEAGHRGRVTPLVADVLDAPRLREIFREHRPQLVFHAAAHKHVYMMERQPAEAVKNNFMGTACVAALAREYGVERFVLISTDKAINPTNVMGASKRLAEYAMQANQQRAGGRTVFLAVRFGNVLGSSGSVIPIFKHQIAAGGPVTVTHPEVTRYFMTIPESVGLVLQAATMGEGGEVFVLDMGTPLKIIDVAKQLIELSGFRPGIDIDIAIVGLRPGEKLHEELRHDREDFAATAHARVLRLVGDPLPAAEVDECLGELAGAINTLERDAVKLLIRKWVPEYTPHLGPVEVNDVTVPGAGASAADNETAIDEGVVGLRTLSQGPDTASHGA